MGLTRWGSGECGDYGRRPFQQPAARLQLPETERVWRGSRATGIPAAGWGRGLEFAGWRRPCRAARGWRTAPQLRLLLLCAQSATEVDLFEAAVEDRVHGQRHVAVVDAGQRLDDHGHRLLGLDLGDRVFLLLPLRAVVG